MKKKTSILIYPLLAIGFLLILTNGCKKDDDKSTITDIDGNVYHTVTIGTQTWMLENLKVTKYRNGDAIPNVTDGDEWSNLTTGAYCEYQNSASNTKIFGKLYNWYSISDSRNIAPTGWHVASYDEWTTLATFLGGVEDGGGKLKEEGTTHWQSPNEGATNETGFTALPAGYRNSLGSFNDLYNTAYFWSVGKYFWYLHYYDNNLNGVGSIYNNLGFSIRCIKD
jgi:uncharacterized protein (TIGR02145 family)